MERFLFFKHLFKNWRRTGSVTPSSPFLADKMLAPVDFSSAKLIVELGAGTGPITKEILLRMRPDAELLVVELNPEFCDVMRKIKDSRLTVYEASALHFSSLLSGRKADYIISGIPLAVVGEQDRRGIFEEIKKTLSPAGLFIQFQYSLASLKDLEDNFDQVKVGFTPINIPPAFVYYSQKKTHL